MKYYRVPSGFKKVEDDSVIYDGATVYLNPAYVAEDESPRRIVVMETPRGGTYLLADNKKMYNKGEGYLYGKYSIAYYKNPQ